MPSTDPPSPDLTPPQPNQAVLRPDQAALPVAAPAPPPPDRVADGHAHYLPLPPHAPLPPPVPGRSKSRRWLLVAGVGCLLAAVLFGALTAAQYRRDQSPQTAVRRYFAALAAGHAAVALGLAANPPRGSYLTDAVLRQQLQLAPLADLTVQNTALSGGQGVVSVRYLLRFAGGDQQVTDSVPVVRRGSSWRLARVATEAQVSITSTGADRLTLAGGRLPTGSVLLFPGALPLGTDNRAVQVDGRPSIQLGPADRQTSEVGVSLTDAAKSSLQASLDHALASCLTDSSAEPDCPVAGDSRPVPGSLRGTVLPTDRPLQINLGMNGRVELAGTVTVRGSWQDWDFNNQPVRHTGDTDVDLHASASVADLRTIYWSRS